MVDTGSIPLVVQLLLLALAAARVTVLLVDDLILDTPRAWVFGKLAGHPKLIEGLQCPWCVGWWVALIIYCAWLVADGATLLLAGPWAVAQVAWWAGGAWLPEGD